MQLNLTTRREIMATLLVSLVALVAIAVTAGTVWAAAVTAVSQRGRSFKPSAVEIARGDTLRIVNDDGELLHHVYLDSGRVRFDSGEMEPGGAATIMFATAGSYTVQCRIHPRMKLAVEVR